MSPTSPLRHRAALAAITSTALIVPPLIATPAQAEGCDLVGKKGGSCNLVIRKPGSGGRGGGPGTGGGGSSGPVMPPPPEGLTANEAPGVVQVPGGGAPPQPAAPATADLLATVRAGTVFPVPTVHTAPENKTYVRLRTSLWVTGIKDPQTTPISDGGQTVSLVATPKSVTWKLGEKEIVCADAGSKDGKNCSYTYRRSSAGQPGGAWHIVATVNWHVTWTCDGDACDTDGGDLGISPVSSDPKSLVVSEIQTNTNQ